ncbi:Methionine aminopeptidase 1 [Ceratobasidium sp. 414]|nr:Methionine aminopeptidase 1 [Ceratobasidium sp. 414]
MESWDFNPTAAGDPLGHRTSGSHGSVSQHGVFGMGDINTAGKEEYRQHIRDNASTDDLDSENDGYTAEPESEILVVPEEPVIVYSNAPLTPVQASPLPTPMAPPEVIPLLLSPPAISPGAKSSSDLGSSPRSLSGIPPRSPNLAGPMSGSSRASSPTPGTPPPPNGFWKRLAGGAGTGKASKRERVAGAVNQLLERTASRSSGLPAAPCKTCLVLWTVYHLSLQLSMYYNVLAPTMHVLILSWWRDCLENKPEVSCVKTPSAQVATRQVGWNVQRVASSAYRGRFSVRRNASKALVSICVNLLVSIPGTYPVQGKTHKVIHNKGGVVPAGGQFNPFYNFPFTGTLRPVYPLSPRRVVPPEIPRPDYAEDGIPHSERLRDALSIKILTPEEQESMRVVCRLSREVLDIAAAAVRPGITTDEIDAIVHEETIKRGAYPSPLNYREFPKSVCTSVNEVICHGIPDQRKLEEGDIINLGRNSVDVSLFYKGKCASLEPLVMRHSQVGSSRLSRRPQCELPPNDRHPTLLMPFGRDDYQETYPVGKISEDSKKLIRTTRKCLDAAIALCKPGTLFRDLGKAIVVRSYTGHGIHNLFHPAPNIPHYAKNKATGTMKPGMMINLGSSWEDTHWPDNWTAVTVDGARSAQFEETLLVTETGVEVLTAGKPREDLL